MLIDRERSLDRPQVDVINAAYGMQDASNMIAIVAEWHRLLRTLSASGLDSRMICHHPATLIMVDKLVSLSQYSDDRVDRAYAARRELVEIGKTEWTG